MNKGNGALELPAGFRFHPTDDELVTHYLCRKCGGLPISVPIIAEIDLYKFDPWQLPEMALYGEKEWYFFSPRDRKYPNGSRPNRAAGTGYWKATGADKPIGRPKAMGIKKALVFYAGKAPRGIKTNWIMHEYRLANVDRSAGSKKNNLRLDDWVLCRIYNKKGAIEKHYNVDKRSVTNYSEMEDSQVDQKPNILMLPSDHHRHNSGVKKEVLQQYMETSDSIPRLHTDSSCSEQVLSPDTPYEKEVPSDHHRHNSGVKKEVLQQHMETSDSMPRLHTDSSCSEQVLSPDTPYEKEVQCESQVQYWKEEELDGGAFGFSSFNNNFQYMDGFQDDPFGTQVDQFQMDQLSFLLMQ